MAGLDPAIQSRNVELRGILPWMGGPLLIEKGPAHGEFGKTA
jgi:hypothetical protein